MCVEDALEAIGVEVEKVAGDCKNRDFKNQVYLLKKNFSTLTHLLPQEIVS